MTVKLDPKTVLKFLSLVVIVLLVPNLLGAIARLFPGNESISGLIDIFDFNSESNIPTLYSSVNMLIAAVLLVLIATQHRLEGSAWLSWLGLSVVITFLAIDETAAIHEKLTELIRHMLNQSGFLSSVWVIPYLLLSGFLGFLYFDFLMELPKKTLSLFVISGAVFIFGAAGLDLSGSFVLQSVGSPNVFYRLLYTFEELLEMFGVILFIYALLDYMVTEFGSCQIDMIREKGAEDISRRERQEEKQIISPRGAKRRKML